MFRQRNNKDCAVTVLAHVLGIPYTNVVNAFPAFRYTRSRKRTHRDRQDRIPGRARALIPRVERENQSVETCDPDYGRFRYNELYRVRHFPYFCGFGISARESMAILTDTDVLFVRERYVTDLSVLRHVPYAILSVPSLNFKTSGHVVIWRAGRIWDPSPKKRYNWSRLRMAKRIGITALPKDIYERDRIKTLLRYGVDNRMLMIEMLAEAARKLELDVPETTWSVTFDAITQNFVATWNELPTGPPD